MKKKIKLTKTMDAMEKYIQAINAGYDVEDEQVWSDIIGVFESETGIKVPQQKPRKWWEVWK